MCISDWSSDVCSSDLLGDVFLDALDGRELVEDAVHLDARDRGARDGAEQGATQGVAERVAEAGLQRPDDEPRTELVDGFLRQCRALSDTHGFFPFLAPPLFTGPELQRQTGGGHSS